MKSEDNRVFAREDEIKDKWKNYFHKIYNKNQVRGVRLDNTSFS